MVHQVTRFYEHRLGRELSEEERSALSSFVEALGPDFGSWYFGVREIDWPRPYQLPLPMQRCPAG